MGLQQRREEPWSHEEVQCIANIARNCLLTQVFCWSDPGQNCELDGDTTYLCDFIG